MEKPTILISGAAGKTGTAAVHELLSRGVPVRAMVRRHDARAERMRSAGAEIVTGSLEDFVDLRFAMTGIRNAYYCPPLEAGTLRRAMLFAAAAKAESVEAIVQLSQWISDPIHPAIHSREKWLTTEVLKSFPGIGVVTIQPGFFADNYFGALESMAQFGLMALPLGNGLNAPPSNEDIGRVIAAILIDPAPHVGKAYRPTGPRLLAPDEIAAIIGKVLGRTVTYRDVPIELFIKYAKSISIPDFVLSQLYWYLKDYRAGAFGIGAPTGAMMEIVGAPAEEFEQTVRRYVAASAVATTSLFRKARAIRGVVKAIFTRTPSITHLDDRLAIPHITHQALAADSAMWRATHDAIEMSPSCDREP